MKNKLDARYAIWMVALGVVFVVVGVLLYMKLDELFHDYVGSQVSKQAATMAELVNEKIDIQLKSMEGLSHEIEKDNDRMSEILNAYVDVDSNISYGVLTINGNLVYGDSSLMLNARDYTGITNSSRGNFAASYKKGEGFLLSVPVFRNRNVRYVLYKFFSEDVAKNIFGMKCYDGNCYASIRDEDGKEVIGSLNEKYGDSPIWGDSRFADIRSHLKDLLNVSISASILEREGMENFFVFMADLKLPGLSLVGVVPSMEAAKGIENINRLIFLVFGLLVVLFIVGYGYLVVSQRKIEENKSLRHAKNAAENASVAKSQFLANMSHEIRTPINGILGMDTMLLKECKDPVLREYAQNIQSAGHTLLSLINDVLDISKIESGKMEIVPVEYSLFSVLNDSYNMFAMRAKDKSLKFTINVDPHVPSGLMGDEVRVRQIMNNLLSNAVKYTPQGEISLNVRYERIQPSNPLALPDVNMINLIISVTDTGIGIREEDREKLFQTFTRLEEKRNRNIEGSGLGLNLTKHLVDLMRGVIRVDSVYGKGSTFVVSIPQVVKKETPMGDFDARYKDYVSSTDTVRGRFRAPKAEILVVDDVPMNLRVMKGLLKETQIQIDVANNGMECLEKIKRKHYDEIFLDHMMPVMDGIETLGVMKTLSGNPNENTPVIMLTANAIAGVRETYMKAGFDDYLSKPVREETLLAMLRKHLPQELVIMEDETSVQEVPEKVELRRAPLEMKTVEKEVAPVAAKTESAPAKNEMGVSLPPQLTALSDTGFVDVKVGLGYCMNDVSFYQEMLEEYKSSPKDEILEDALKAEDFERYRIEVHALKSTSLMIGEVELSSHAKAMEFACKEGRYEDVLLNHANLIREYRNFLNVLKETL